MEEALGVNILLIDNRAKGTLASSQHLVCFNYSLVERRGLSSVAGSLEAERREWGAFCTT